MPVRFFSVCLQTAAVAVFGGGAWQKYKAKSNTPILQVDWTSAGDDVYFNWCYWMAVAGGGLTLLSGLLFLVHDCYLERRRIQISIASYSFNIKTDIVY